MLRLLRRLSIRACVVCLRAYRPTTSWFIVLDLSPDTAPRLRCIVCLLISKIDPSEGNESGKAVDSTQQMLFRFFKGLW